ncbi:unnamed protein product [Fusarium graminearum]|nr:unnamed protein product [Fusarium graminearum]CAG1975693.1 unnamed protein product [Fusarium graminearum]VTO87503.1 unnamed protein product [Fusarium graminearum]
MSLRNDLAKGANARGASEGLAVQAAIVKIGRAGRTAAEARKAEEKRARRDAMLVRYVLA